MAAGIEVGTNDVLVMVSVWVQVTVVEVTLEVGGRVVVLFELGPELFDFVTT